MFVPIRCLFNSNALSQINLRSAGEYHEWSEEIDHCCGRFWVKFHFKSQQGIRIWPMPRPKRSSTKIARVISVICMKPSNEATSRNGIWKYRLCRKPIPPKYRITRLTWPRFGRIGINRWSMRAEWNWTAIRRISLAKLRNQLLCPTILLRRYPALPARRQSPSHPSQFTTPSIS